MDNQAMGTGRTAESATILVVDDDAATRLLCSAALDREGFLILQAADSAEALRHCESHAGDIALCLLDLLLPPKELRLAADRPRWPTVHGVDLKRKVRALRPGARVLFMSAYTRDELQGQGLTLDAEQVLKKPFTAELLRRAVREVLAQPPEARESSREAGTEPGKAEIQWFD